MKVVRAVVKLLLILVVLTGIVGIFLPSSVHVERSAVIQAPQATIYVLIDGFENFNRWSPWYERDPNADYTYEGPQRGVGAKMSWSSEQREVGSGSQEIVAGSNSPRLWQAGNG
jgi:hypothetical protein